MASKYLDDIGLAYLWGKIKGWVNGPDSGVLHKTGTETVSGEKVFSGIQTTAAGNETALMVIKDATLVKGETPATNHFLTLGFIDSTGDSYAQDTAIRLGAVEYKSPSEANPNGYMQLVDFGFNGGGSALLQVGHDKDNIRYATAPATSNDRTESTDIVTRGYMEASEWNWQKTKKNAVVQFKPVPESDLEPVVDFMFTETPPVSGDKGPENPSTITGVSSIHVTRSGKNLLNIPFKSSSTSHGITFTPSADGSISISGTYTGGSSYYTLMDDLYLPAGETLYLSIKEGPHSSLYNAVLQLVAHDTNNAEISIIWQRLNANPIPITIPDGVKYRIRLGVFNTLDPSAPVVITPMAELVSLSQEWVPFEDYDLYTIQFGDTYYGGSLDVATGVMTATWYGEYLQTPTTAELFSTTVRANGYFTKAHKGANYSTVVSNYGGTYVYARYSPGARNYSIQLPYETLGLTAETATVKTALAAMQDFLIAHPCFVVYTVNAPEIVQLTPTQIRSLPALDKYEPRINTVYTDQEAVQVGYQRYAGEDNLVHRTGNESIYGVKKFCNDVHQTDFVGSSGDTPAFILNSTHVTAKGTAPSTSAAHAIIPFMPKDYFNFDYNNRLAAISYIVNTDTTLQVSLTVSDFVVNSTTYHSVILEKTSANAYCFRPSSDNLLSLGTANRRWTQVFANTATISTSDERLKTAISLLPDEVLDAWGKVAFKQFKMSASVEEKGDSARTHCGLIAQDIKRTFEADGLDASEYGLYCYDEWEAREESKSEDGEVLFPKREAGDQYSLRYEEALCMEAAYMRRENARLKKRIAGLEERLEALELLLKS